MHSGEPGRKVKHTAVPFNYFLLGAKTNVSAQCVSLSESNGTAYKGPS